MNTTLVTLATGGLDLWVAATLYAVSFLSSFVTISLGIGGGALLLTTMASLVPATALIPVHGVIQFGSGIFRAAVLAPHIHWPPVAAFAVGSAVGAALGGMVVVELPPAFVTIGVGTFVIFSVLAKAPAWFGRHGWFAGLVSSFLTMFFGATGLFVAVYGKTLKLDRQPHVATHATFMTLQHLLKVVVFGILGFAFGPWMGFIALMMAFGVLGTLSGRMLLVRMSDHGFKRALDIVLILISLRLIWIAVADLSR